jgi:hypothetical protein
MEVERVQVGKPSVVPVTDVGVSYDGVELTITLPRYLDRSTIERHLRNICKKCTPYAYRCHTWRNAVAEPKQREL